MARWRFMLGFAVASIALLAIGETALRIVPPRAVQPYLTDYDRPGPFRNDARYGVQYKSWDTLRQDYANEFPKHGDLLWENPPPSWAMFGSSFVHAPDMLADTSRKHVKNRRVFNLGRNELLYVRAAQIDLLLEHGLKPEHILFALMPLDVSVFAKQSFAMVHAGPNGAMTFDVQKPGVGGVAIEHSRLALSAWVRAEMQHFIPHYNPSVMTRRMDPRILSEVDYLFARLGELSERHHVPVTVLLIPNYEQIVKGAGFAFQDELTRIARQYGLHVLDVRDVFCNYTDKSALFIPDKHFTDIGNRMLLAEWVKHLHALGQANDVQLPEGFPG